MSAKIKTIFAAMAMLLCVVVLFYVTCGTKKKGGVINRREHIVLTEGKTDTVKHDRPIKGKGYLKRTREKPGRYDGTIEQQKLKLDVSVQADSSNSDSLLLLFAGVVEEKEVRRVDTLAMRTVEEFAPTSTPYGMILPVAAIMIALLAIIAALALR